VDAPERPLIFIGHSFGGLVILKVSSQLLLQARLMRIRFYFRQSKKNGDGPVYSILLLALSFLGLRFVVHMTCSIRRFFIVLRCSLSLQK
jgi:hypothetical protein